MLRSRSSTRCLTCATSCRDLLDRRDKELSGPPQSIVLGDIRRPVDHIGQHQKAVGLSRRPTAIFGEVVLELFPAAFAGRGVDGAQGVFDLLFDLGIFGPRDLTRAGEGV